MKICYIGDSKCVHTLRFAKYFAKKGDDVCIIDFNTDKDDVLGEGVRVYTLKDDEKQFISYKKQLSSVISKTKPKSVVSKRSFFLKVKILIEFLYTWLIGHILFIPCFPSWFLQLSLNSEIIQMDRYAAKAKKLLKKIKPDIVHSQYLTSWGYIAARTGFKPLISTALGSDVLLRPDENFAMRMKLRYAMNRSTVLTSDAICLSQRMISHGADKSKIKEFNYGVDLGKFFPLQKKTHLPPTIIHTRNLAPLYNVELFLKALPSILESVPSLRVFLKNTGPLKEDIATMIKEWDLETTLTLLDWLSEDELAHYYRNSHIYVSLSKSDSTSVSLLEAMASGCFPVVSDIPANREWIKDGVNGFLIPLGSIKILPEKIITVFANGELRERAATENTNIIKYRADWSKNINELESTYASLIDSKV
jgi:glycosyltransferase involved in cell wall biosynthesis